MTQAPPAGYGQPHHGPAKNNGLGIAALIVGIISLLISVIPCVNLLGIVGAVIGIGLGIAGWVSASGKPDQKATLAIFGVILSVIAIIVAIIVYVAIAAFGGQIGEGVIRAAVRQEAGLVEQDARAAGVDDATISEARAELDTAIENLSIDFSDEAATEKSMRDLGTALESFYQKLKDAAGPDADIRRPSLDADDFDSGSGAEFEFGTTE